ncbi:MAG: hypothetical protein HXY37_18710 [Chloroflexi bacterium]|nr:hypothetical protein [Chloroflexota bacterium]
MHEAQRDPQLVAQVEAQRPLTYAAGADPALDRPAHVRAASSLVRLGRHMVAIQDDAHFLALIDPATWAVAALTLPAGPDGQRQFDDLRGTRALKLDLEASVVVPGPDGDLLLALGSGSTPERERILMVEQVTSGEPAIRLVAASALYAQLRAPAFAGSELNLEGAVLLGTTLRLFQRGNGAPRGALQPIDATCDLHWPALAAYLANPSVVPPPELTAITRYDLGRLAGARLTFTDATLAPGGILYCATAEDSPDVTRDGPVVGSALGLLPFAGHPRYAPLTGPDGQVLPIKVEGALLDATDPTRIYLVADADDPLTPSELLVTRLLGPWFPAAATHPPPGTAGSGILPMVNGG